MQVHLLALICFLVSLYVNVSQADRRCLSQNHSGVDITILLNWLRPVFSNCLASSHHTYSSTQRALNETGCGLVTLPGVSFRDVRCYRLEISFICTNNIKIYVPPSVWVKISWPLIVFVVRAEIGRLYIYVTPLCIGTTVHLISRYLPLHTTSSTCSRGNHGAVYQRYPRRYITAVWQRSSRSSPHDRVSSLFYSPRSLTSWKGKLLLSARPSYFRIAPLSGRDTHGWPMHTLPSETYRESLTDPRCAKPSFACC